MVSSHITILSILIWLIWKILTHSRLARVSWSFKFMPATLEPHEVDASVKSVLLVASFIHDISTRGCLHSLLLYVHCAFVLLKWSRSPQCLRFLLAGSSTLPSASMDDGEDCYTWFISFPLCLLIFSYWIISNHALCIASLLFQLLVVFSCIPHDFVVGSTLSFSIFQIHLTCIYQSFVCFILPLTLLDRTGFWSQRTFWQQNCSLPHPVANQKGEWWCDALSCSPCILLPIFSMNQLSIFLLLSMFQYFSTQTLLFAWFTGHHSGI